MIRVVVADDQELVRDGFAMILAADPAIEVVGRAADGAEALAMVRAADPDVVLMDVQMPRVDGIAATRLVLAERPSCRVLVLTTYDADDYVLRALQAGATGYLLKDSPRQALVAAVHAAAAGDVLLDRGVAARLVAAREQAPPDPAAAAALRQLTPREREVLAAVGEGSSNAEIAAALGIGESTTKTHVARLLQKTGCRDRVQLVVLAHRHGVV